MMEGGSNIADSPVVNFDDPKIVTFNITPTQAGTYTVSWRVVTPDDNGVSEGKLTFKIGESAAPPGGDTMGTTNTAGGASGAPLPTTGQEALLPGAALALAVLLLGAGLVLRRARVTRAG
jgi:LPXTG-motif cell wall-anchored protein